MGKVSFDNFESHKAVYLVVSFRLTPVSSGSDATMLGSISVPLTNLVPVYKGNPVLTITKGIPHITIIVR